MTFQEQIRARLDIGITISQISNWCIVSENAVRRWRSGTFLPVKLMQRKIIDAIDAHIRITP